MTLNKKELLSMWDQQQKKEEELDAPELQPALKKNTHNGPDTNKRNKKRAMMMILCSFSPCPDDALLAREATYRKKKKNLSITLRKEENRWFDLRTTWEIRDLGKPLHVLPLPFFDRRTTYLLLDSSRSVRIYGQSIGPRIYSSIR